MNIYQNLCTQYYELDKPDAPSGELAFYLEYAQSAKGPIFEPMCGTGRFLIPMLKQGFAIEGSDASTYMLAVCREKCRQLGLNPVLHQQYLHQMALNKKFALIFIPSGSFGLITDTAEAKKCLKLFFDHLLPNGKLVFEIETVHAIPQELGKHQQRFVSTKQAREKIILDTVSSYERTTQVLHTRCCYDLVRDDKRIATETENLAVRYYQDNEIAPWLQEAGFSEVRHKAFERTSPGAFAASTVYECIKKTAV